MPSYSRWLGLLPVLSLSIVSTPRVTFGTDPNWDAFGGSQTAPNGPVFAVAQAGDVLYIGGSFTSPAAFIARIHDNEVSALANGVNADVNAILFESGELYAGGVVLHGGHSDRITSCALEWRHVGRS